MILDIGRISIARHHIRLQPDTSPIYLRPYRHSQSDTEEIRRQIVALKKKGLVRDSISPWSSPVTLAQKKNGDRRLCIDYRRLNQVTVDERHPLPIIQDVFDRMSSARYFSTWDIAWAYWHIALDEESIEKTAFSTLDGHYEWLVLPFGMKNSPATFQRIIPLIVQDLLPKGVDAYLDDIIIYTRTEEEHLQLLEEVLSRLLQHNAKLRREKCVFFTKQIQYLGHIISGGTLQPAPEKLQAVAEFPVPTTLKQLERFLGLTSYYRRYIHRFSFIAEPLHRLKKKGVDFVWGTDQQMAFDTLKKKLTEPPVVAIFDDNKPTFLHTDASEIGIGSILMQKNDQNQKEVIAYYSRRLTEAESKYDNCERECLAVVESVDHFRIYLHGRKFDIYSDNSALQWLFSIKKPTGRLYRWSVRLSVYSYTIHHRKGSKNLAADALSRDPIAFFITTEEMISEQKKCDLSSFRNTSTRDGQTTVRTRGVERVFTPPSLRLRVIQHYHDDYGHPSIRKTQQLISSAYWWPQMTDDIKNHVKTCTNCQMVKTSNRPTLGNLNPIPTPSLPFDIWALDTIVLGPAANDTRAKYAQVFIDHHSRYIWASPTAKNTTDAVLTVFRKLVSSGVQPKILITDNGKNFISKNFKSFLKDNDIQHRLISPYHPEANGLVEKANHTLITGIKLHLLDHPKHKWTTALTEVVKNYNRTPIQSPASSQPSYSSVWMKITTPSL